MIVAACTDDPMVETIARTAAEWQFDVFGRWYKVYHEKIPDLGVTEN